MYFIFAVLSGFFLSVGEIFLKRYYSKHSHISAMILVYFLDSILLLPLLAFYEIKDINFFKVSFLCAPLEIIASLLYFYSIKNAEISKVSPLLAFTPLFIPFLEQFTGMRLKYESIFSISIFFVGAWMVTTDNFLKPLKSFGKPSIAMLFCATIYSITSILGRHGVLYSNPLFFLEFYNIILLIFITPLTIKFGRGIKFEKEIFLASLFYSISSVFHMLSIENLPAQYMIPLKRTSIIFSIIFGTQILKEENLKRKIIGGALIFLSIIYITQIAYNNR